MYFKTERLLIRPIHIDDKELLLAYRSDSITNRFQTWIPKSIDNVEEFISQISPTINIPDTWFQFVIILEETGKLIGDVGLHFIDKENKQVEIGCTIDLKHQNLGYATEALTEIITFVFKDLNKHRIIASVDPRNESSKKLVEKLGLRLEGHFTESLFINGAWVDDLIYAILRKEWEER